MYQGRSNCATLLRHCLEMAAEYGENFRWFQGDHISWRSYHPRIRQHTSDIPWIPLNGFVWPGATIDEQSQSSGKNDVKSIHRVTLHTQHVAGIQLQDGSVSCQPLQLRPGRGAEGLMFSQSIDEVSCTHWLTPISRGIAANTISRHGKTFGFGARPSTNQPILGAHIPVFSDVGFRKPW